MISVHIEASLIRRVCFCQLFLEMGFHGIYTFSYTRKEIPSNLSRNIIPFAAAFSIIPLLQERSFLSRWKSSRETNLISSDSISRHACFFRFDETKPPKLSSEIPEFESFAGRRLILIESLISLPFHSSTMDLVRGNELTSLHVKGLLPPSIITIRKIKFSLPFPPRPMSMIRSQLAINFFLL